MPPVQVGGQDSSAVAQATLKREAVYNAVCVAQYGLHDHVDFSAWLNSSLLKVRLMLHRLGATSSA
jgi:hypothetical protein